jgi:hypothetical protein
VKTDNARMSGAQRVGGDLVAVIEGQPKWKLVRADQGGRRRYRLIIEPHFALDVGAETARRLAELILADCAGPASGRPTVIPKPENAVEGVRYRLAVPAWELKGSAVRPGRHPGAAVGRQRGAER